MDMTLQEMIKAASEKLSLIIAFLPAITIKEEEYFL